MIAWIAQGLEKVVPKPELKSKESAGADQPAEVLKLLQDVLLQIKWMNKCEDPDPTGPYWTLLDLTGPYLPSRTYWTLPTLQTLLDPTGPYLPSRPYWTLPTLQTLLDCTGPYWTVLVPTGPYLPSRPYWTLPTLQTLLDCTGPYWTVLVPTGP